MFDYGSNLWKSYPRAEGGNRADKAANAKAGKGKSIAPASMPSGPGNEGDEEKIVAHAPLHMTGKIPGPRSSAVSVIKVRLLAPCALSSLPPMWHDHHRL